MEMFELANELIVLLTSALGLIGTGVGTFFAIKFWIKNNKNKSTQELWALIMEMADAAMAEAEKTNATGAEKKEMVIQAVSAGTKAAGVDMDIFLNQLSNYIDQTIAFVNRMK
jgi:hypothetical protein